VGSPIQKKQANKRTGGPKRALKTTNSTISPKEPTLGGGRRGVGGVPVKKSNGIKGRFPVEGGKKAKNEGRRSIS